MALCRYNFNVSSPLLVGRRTSFVTYFNADADALAAAALIDAQLANNAEVQVSKVIKEPEDTSCNKETAVDPVSKKLSFCNSEDTLNKVSWDIKGLIPTVDADALANALAALNPHIQSQDGVDMDTVLSSNRGINLFTGGTPRKSVAPIV